MTYLCTYFFIFVASLDPLSKNKSRIIIQKCRNFCKQLTLPGRTVQQLPFFKTVWLYTVKLTLCTYNYNILLLLITYVSRPPSIPIYSLQNICVTNDHAMFYLQKSQNDCEVISGYILTYLTPRHSELSIFVCLFAHYVYMSGFYLYIIFPCF